MCRRARPEARLGLLALAALVVAGGELLARGAKANRWWEYSMVFSGGGVGALLGTSLDVVTATISPEYFAVGKVLGTAPG
jgi:hypothetical protein